MPKVEKNFFIVPNEIIDTEDLTLMEKMVLIALMRYENNNAGAYPSYSTIARKCGIGRRTAIQVIQKLCAKGLIEKQVQYDAKKQKSNKYIVHTMHHLIEHEQVKTQNEKSSNINTLNEGGSAPDAPKKELYKNNYIKNNNKKNNNYNKNINTNNILKEKETEEENNSSCSSCCNSDVYKFYEQSGFGTLNLTITEMINSDIEIYTKEWVIEAMKEAVRQNKYKYSYVEGILRNWKTNGRIQEKGEDQNGLSSTDKSNHTKLKVPAREYAEYSEDELRKAGIL